MDFLKRLFGGGGTPGGPKGDPDGMYFYVRSTRTGEVIRVRLHRYNDLSQSEDDRHYFARKVVVGQKSFDRIEVAFNFNQSRQLIDADVTGGTLVDQDEYDTYLESLA